jgi:hypothetical protein
LINDLEISIAPRVYAPAGGLSGRTTFGADGWLIAWGVWHSRWKSRQVGSRRVFTVTLILIELGILATFPPVWALF